MTRRELREIIFKLLFMAEFHSREDMPEQTEWFLDNRIMIDEHDREYVQTKIDGILDHIPSLDQQIEEVCDRWKLDRIGKSELAILRLAVYEMTQDSDIPTKVAINEAVELSKKYCTLEASRFVNGVLANIA